MSGDRGSAGPDGPAGPLGALGEKGPPGLPGSKGLQVKICSAFIACFYVCCLKCSNYRNFTRFINSRIEFHNFHTFPLKIGTDLLNSSARLLWVSLLAERQK